MVASEPNLKFLSAILVLLWPSRIIFLHDLAILDDPLDLRDEERTDTH